MIGRLDCPIRRSVAQRLRALSPLASSSYSRFLIVLLPFIFLLSHSLSRSFDAPAFISNLYSYCSIYVYKTVLVRGQAPALAIRRLYPLGSTRVSQDSTRVSGPFQTLALNAQVQKDRFLTAFSSTSGMWTSACIFPFSCVPAT